MNKNKTKCPIRNNPETVCSLCGEEWISDKISEDIEAVVKEAKMKNRMIEVVNFSLENVAWHNLQ